MNFRERLKNGDVVVGSWINTGSPVVAELMAAAGFDFLAVDAEHSAVDVPQARAMFQAMAAANPDCTPMVRLPGNDYAVTKRYLDAGAMGVIAPLVNSGGEARTLVRSVKYPPLGDRGVGFGRSHGYGFDFDAYMARANDQTVTCVQIEHVDAVRNIDDILAPEEVDAAFIGPYDMTASMGVTAQFDHADYRAALDRVLAACDEHGVAPGIHVVAPEPDQVTARIDDGFRLIAYSLDITMLGTACRDGMSRIREILKRADQ
jgi:2-dehydro-3-deoxyglucarate aldolase